MEGGRRDMLEWLESDASVCVINCLDNPADLARAGAVSKSWRKFVISNEFGKRLCMKLCPEISNFTHIELLNRDTLYPLEEDSSSTSMERQILERAHIVYTYFAHCLLTRDSDKDCAMTCIGASSTDNFPQESIENTLEPSYSVDLEPSYWSSTGQSDPNVQESLVYRLESDLYLVNEIRIRPFKALFQIGHPIYSAKHVRFRMGQSKFNLSELHIVTTEEESQLTRDDNYVWTYISPEYCMAQACMLLGLVQQTAASSEVQSCQQTFSDRIQQMRPDTILHTIFSIAPLQFVGSGDDDDDRDDIDGDSSDGDDGDHDVDVHALP